ncbi:hypothetical protein Axi01nite_88600 [Actinoplanes xinjiangensis]|nr:hypothetical protein Axi01nite_88600 [Actinoplanes xinjiangensis]
MQSREPDRAPSTEAAVYPAGAAANGPTCDSGTHSDGDDAHGIVLQAGRDHRRGVRPAPQGDAGTGGGGLRLDSFRE